jgi:hypothetical protein
MGWISPVPETRPVAVYKLFNADGEALYFGSSWRPKGRCQQHKYDKSWWPEVDPARTKVTWYETRRAAEEAEKVAIALEQPQYNVDHKCLIYAIKWDLDERRISARSA